ncbi:STAS domain-containing protein [Streptomyces sp. NPDC001568]|uniref:STAS domain-containing protein n=1 Tax=Streptomyces sp. NPDC001568 TaxID=3364588 RepID=UPI0036BDB56E
MEDRDGSTRGVWMNDDDRCLVIHVGGEMDIDRAPMLRNALLSAATQADGRDEIVLDLSDLSFCDSAGLNTLIQARQTAATHGKRISLRNPQPQIVRLLEMTGVDALFLTPGT